MADKSPKHEAVQAEDSSDLQTFVLPELGLTVRAKDATEAAEKAKKQAKESK